jgi:hypothetical protein
MINEQKNVLRNSRPSSVSSTVHNRKVKKKHHNLFQIILSGLPLKESRGSNKTNNIIVITAIVSLMSIIRAVVFPFEHSQAASALLQKSTSNNNPYFSLSILSTAAGTGAAATGIMTTVPGVLRTRKQSKYLTGYLLKIHYKYDDNKITMVAGVAGILTLSVLAAISSTNLSSRYMVVHF